MFAQPFDDGQGYRIWLDRDEIDLLISQASTREDQTAYELGCRSGLRVQEIVSVEAKDVVSTSAGPRVRVWDSKGKQYRETPTTRNLLAQAETVADLQGPESNLVDCSARSVQRHLSDDVDELAEQHDEMWTHVTPHDLRRSWATLLSADIDDPLLIMDWGGWEDMDTFLEHYRGSYSPAVQREELEKVGWLDADSQSTEAQSPELRILESS